MTPRRRWALAALVALLAVPGRAEAQAGGAPVFSWVVTDLKMGICVDFLIDPAVARGLVPEGYRVVPATHSTGLSPIVAREIAGDSVHLAWIPSRYCVLEGASVTAGDQFVTSGKDSVPVMLAYWGIAADRNEGEPRFDQLFALQFWTSDWHVQKPSQDAFIQVATLKRSLTKVPESINDRYEIRMGKTSISWEGQLRRDSTAVTTPLAAPLLYVGLRAIHFSASVTGQPAWSRNPAGVLQVTGKDDLAQAMQASPIRHFGPVFWGGNARVDFSR